MADSQTIEKPKDEGTQSPPAAASPPNPETAPLPASKRTSIFEDVGVDEPNKEGTTTWPSTWREDMVKGIENPKAADVLKRYGSPSDLAKAFLSAQEKIRSGEYKRSMPDPTDEKAVAAWRAEQDIPDKPEAYEFPDIGGVKYAEMDEPSKAVVSEFQKAFHEENIPKGTASKLAGTLVKVAEAQMMRQAEGDAIAMERVEDTLRAEWGREYRTNVKMGEAFMSADMGDETNDVLMARMPNGTRLADNPRFVKALAKWARGAGSDIFVDDNGGGAKSLEQQKAEIEKVMKTDFSRYQREFEPQYRKILDELEARGKL